MSMRKQFVPVCVNCTLDPNGEEAMRFQCRYVRRKLRVILERLPGQANAWRCPRCGGIHYNRNFFKGAKRYRKL